MRSFYSQVVTQGNPPLIFFTNHVVWSRVVNYSSTGKSSNEDSSSIGMCCVGPAESRWCIFFNDYEKWQQYKKTPRIHVMGLLSSSKLATCSALCLAARFVERTTPFPAPAILVGISNFVFLERAGSVGKLWISSIFYLWALCVDSFQNQPQVQIWWISNAWLIFVAAVGGTWKYLPWIPNFTPPQRICNVSVSTHNWKFLE